MEDEWLAGEDVLRDKTLTHFSPCRLVDPFYVSSVGDHSSVLYRNVLAGILALKLGIPLAYPVEISSNGH